MEQGAPHARAVYMVMGLVREVAGCENWYKCSSSLNFFQAVSHHPNATLRLSFLFRVTFKEIAFQNLQLIHVFLETTMLSMRRHRRNRG